MHYCCTIHSYCTIHCVEYNFVFVFLFYCTQSALLGCPVLQVVREDARAARAANADRAAVRDASASAAGGRVPAELPRAAAARTRALRSRRAVLDGERAPRAARQQVYAGPTKHKTCFSLSHTEYSIFSWDEF